MKYHLFIITLFLLALSGCARFSTPDNSLTLLQQVDQYQEQQQYSKALTLIAESPEDHSQAKELEKKRKEILKQLDLFEQKTISEALKLERQNDWEGTKKTYKDAIRKLNSSKVLEKAKQDMLLRLDARVAALELEELIITGEWLQKKLPLLRSLHESEPGDLSVRWRLSRTEDETKELSLKLLDSGSKMLAEKNLSMAQRTLPLAVALNPLLKTETSVQELNSQLKTKKAKKKKTKRKKTEKHDKNEIAAFNKAMAHKDLNTARLHLKRISSTGKTSMAVELMQERLDNAIATYVQEELTIGNTFYRAGDYEQAINAYNNILTLTPDDGLVKAKLIRANKILEKLNSLKQRQK